MHRRHADYALVALLLLGAAGPAHALKSDRDQPVRLDADHAQMNNATGVSVYTGNVILVQGTLRLTGDKMTIHSLPQGGLSKVIAEGRVTYQQLPDDQPEPIRAKAPVMEYYAVEPGRVILKGGATVTQGRNTFSGQTIEYDLAQDLVTAQRGERDQERIQITIFPEKKPDAPATPPASNPPATPATPAAPASQRP